MIQIRVKYSKSAWSTIWGKCHLNSAFPTRCLPRDKGFMYDLIPTQMRLPNIRLQTTGRCNPCDDTDTIMDWLTCTVTHKLLECIRQRNAAPLRTDPQYVPSKWHQFLISYGQHRHLSRGQTILTSRELMWCYACGWDVRGDLTLNSMEQIHTSVSLLMSRRPAWSSRQLTCQHVLFLTPSLSLPMRWLSYVELCNLVTWCHIKKVR
jgi:hypothetical protein